MPTGYTAAIKDGIDFDTFVWSCARGMGALIMMRDLPTGAPIPERFEPSDYNIKAMDAAHVELVRLQRMTEAEADQEAAKAFDDEETRHVMRAREIDELRIKYEAMLAQVVSWKAPSDEHVEFKEFMASQIRQSLDFDCGFKFDSAKTVRLTGAQWRAAQIDEAKRHFTYHANAHEKEVKRVESRNLWLKQLRESLQPKGVVP